MELTLERNIGDFFSLVAYLVLPKLKLRFAILTFLCVIPAFVYLTVTLVQRDATEWSTSEQLINLVAFVIGFGSFLLASYWLRRYRVVRMALVDPTMQEALQSQLSADDTIVQLFTRKVELALDDTGIKLRYPDHEEFADSSHIAKLVEVNECFFLHWSGRVFTLPKRYFSSWGTEAEFRRTIAGYGTKIVSRSA